MRTCRWWSLGLLLFTACGMAERDDEGSKSYDYIRFADPTFEQYCLTEFDTNHDERLSRYEAESVRKIDCAGLGIGSLFEIEYFTRLEELNCSQNQIAWLDLTQNEQLRVIDCSENRLTHLALGHLRGVSELNCRANQLTTLNLDYTASLNRLDCRENRFTVLDLTSCSVTLEADARRNPSLTTIYCRAGQRINFEAPAEVVTQ